jgi:hypothetical protein
MHNITLICTGHRERGKCNTDELYKIFEQIKPEVIFEETPPSMYDAYYKEHSVSTLETNTIKKYKQEHIIKNIPVDKDYDIKETKKHYDNYCYLNDVFFDNNIRYNNLWGKHLEMTELYGFEYLNSIKYTILSERLHQIEEDIIKNLNDVELFNRYKIWINNISERENEMVKNVYNCGKENNFNNAIFTIGAEHKISIIKKITDMKEERIKINLIYDIYQSSNSPHPDLTAPPVSL